VTHEPLRPRAIVYVDGFNLYYGALRNTPFRWLDLARLSDLMLPEQCVVKVKSFTSIVDDPGGSVRQQVYISALEANGRVRASCLLLCRGMDTDSRGRRRGSCR